MKLGTTGKKNFIRNMWLRKPLQNRKQISTLRNGGRINTNDISRYLWTAGGFTLLLFFGLFSLLLKCLRIDTSMENMG